MSEDALDLGRVVLSRAGRDKGRYFVVVSVIDSLHVGLSDGETHKMAAPKKKKIRHIQPKPELISSLAGKLVQSGRVEDHEVRAALGDLGYSIDKRRECGKGMGP